ncbi:MAG: porin family protein [Gammaproteobacteria bacterium]|nr:porin family protein [Gammaproteobacteria bacterium]MDH5652724.1 porin family protein [Gammaproteobacteria bacterium]
MSTIRKILFALLAVTMAGQVQAAESPLYFGIGVTDYAIDGTGDVSLNGYTGYVGIDLDNIFGLEGVYMNSDTLSDPGGSGNIKLNYAGMGLLRFNLRYNHLTLYLFGGYYLAEIGATINFGTLSSTTALETSGYVYGGGIDLFGTKDTALSVRWYKTADKDESDFNTTTLSIGLHIYYDVPKVFNRY